MDTRRQAQEFLASHGAHVPEHPEAIVRALRALDDAALTEAAGFDVQAEKARVRAQEARTLAAQLHQEGRRR